VLPIYIGITEMRIRGMEYGRLAAVILISVGEKREYTYQKKAQIIYRGIPCTPQRWQDKECILCGVYPLCIFFYLFTFYVRVYFIFFIYVVFYYDVWYYMLPFAVYFLHVEDI
jgi:hypothetical protein